ncbi:hypothetical protein BC831DRAFT_477026 [Entophlyctis helioformis]|nr:hypothetical protein BC831DRAFT_477026 [Entophlyctis helioformis]
MASWTRARSWPRAYAGRAIQVPLAPIKADNANKVLVGEQLVGISNIGQSLRGVKVALDLIGRVWLGG